MSSAKQFISSMFSILRVEPWNELESQLRKLVGPVPEMDLRPVKVLDVGAGTAERWSNIRDSIRAKIDLTVLDIVETTSIPTGYASAARIVADLRDGLEAIPNGSFDVVVCFDVLEHLPLEQGYILLYQLERISRDLMGVAVPNGFAWQPPSPDNPHNAHISAWTWKMLKEFGFDKISGHSGWKPLYGPYGQLKSKSKLKYLAFAIGALALPFPSACVEVSGWMRVTKRRPIAQGFEAEKPQS